MNKRLGANAKTEMIDAAKACQSPAEYAALAKQFAEMHGTTTTAFYRATVNVRPRRKTRSDKGDRIVDIRTDTTCKLMLGWMQPPHNRTAVDAYAQAKARGMSLPFTVETFERWLRENGLTDKTLRKNITQHKRFEASAPGEIGQFDISGCKTRWFDLTTRRIINVPATEVSRNHENTKANRIKVWRFVYIDDFSRKCCVRYIGVAKPNSSHVVDFLLWCYDSMGVPLKLYTDNDQIIKFGRNKRASEILNKILREQGGYENIFHWPGNSRATGKVERLHRTIESCEMAIGTYLEERGSLSLETLNNELAPRIEQKLNNRLHSETGMSPNARWDSMLSVVRRVNYTDLRAAFAADEFTVKVRGDLTFRLKGQSYQIDQSPMYPFASWIGQKVTVVFHDDLPTYTLLGLDGNEYDLNKDLAGPQAAGNTDRASDTSQQIRKEARALAKDDAKRIKAAGETPAIPIFDAPLEEAPSLGHNVFRMGKPETEITLDQVAAVAPGRVTTPYAGAALDFWAAYELLVPEFAKPAECKAFLDTVYTSRDGSDRHVESDLREAMQKPDERRLRAVR